MESLFPEIDRKKIDIDDHLVLGDKMTTNEIRPG